MCKNNCGHCDSCLSSGQGVRGSRSSTATQDATNAPVGFSFLPGQSPTMPLWNPNDIAKFDLSTGLGEAEFFGWGVMDGRTYITPNGTLQPPNMQNRILTGAGDKYQVGDIGGNEKINLSVGQLPAHNHGITLTNPTVNVVDNGHIHGVQDLGHGHSASQTAHSHTPTIAGMVSDSGGHSHRAWATGGFASGDQQGARSSQYSLNWRSATSTDPGAVTDGQDLTDGHHAHPWTQTGGSTDSQQPAVTVNNNTTGIQVQSHSAGISVSLVGGSASSAIVGNGDDINIINPYVALLWVTKLF